MKKQNTERLVLIISLVSLALSVGSWIYAWNLRQDVDRSSVSAIDNIIQLSKKQGLLETCYEHAIKPCTEEAIKALQ